MYDLGLNSCWAHYLFPKELSHKRLLLAFPIFRLQTYSQRHREGKVRSLGMMVVGAISVALVARCGGLIHRRVGWKSGKCRVLETAE
jgi:hypothetical protein